MLGAFLARRCTLRFATWTATERIRALQSSTTVAFAREASPIAHSTPMQTVLGFAVVTFGTLQLRLVRLPVSAQDQSSLAQTQAGGVSLKFQGLGALGFNQPNCSA